MPRKHTDNKASKVDQLVAKAQERAAKAGVEIEPEEYSLEWYRQDWPARKKTFIEREIKIQNAFESNQEVPLILNDAQQELHEGSLASSLGNIEAQLWKNPKLFMRGIAKPKVLASLEDQLRNSDSLSEDQIEIALSLICESLGLAPEEIEKDRTDTTLKCRRIGGTTYYQADYLADAIIEGNHNVRFVAHDPDTVAEFLVSVKFMYDHLSHEIKPIAQYNSKDELAFNDQEKKVVSSFKISTVVPGKEEKGRGQKITRLHLTEIPFWQGDRKKAYVALKDAAKGGKCTEESTGGGVGDEFHDDYQKGKKRKAGYRSHFFAWWWNRNYQVPGYRIEQHGKDFYLLRTRQDIYALTQQDKDKARLSVYTSEERQKQDLLMQSEKDCAEAILTHLKTKGYVSAGAHWHCEEVAAFLAWRRSEIEEKGERDFRREYPENDVDPFTQAGGMVFGANYLIVRAKYRDAEPGHEYKVFLDPSNGIEGADPYSITVIDCNTGEQVYEEGGIKKQDFQGQRCCELSDKYNGAEIGIESNMGEAAILEVERLGYGHRLYKHIDAQTQRDIAEGRISYMDAWLRARPGLALTDRMKRLVINNFEKAWRTGDFKCASDGLIDEARVFVQTGEQMAAKSGHHDDRVMANAECWYLVENSRGGSVGYISTGEKLGSAMTSAY